MLSAFFDQTKKLPKDIENNIGQDDGCDSDTVVDGFTTPKSKRTSGRVSTSWLDAVETISPLSFLSPKEESSTPSSQASTTSPANSDLDGSLSSDSATVVDGFRTPNRKRTSVSMNDSPLGSEPTISPLSFLSPTEEDSTPSSQASTISPSTSDCEGRHSSEEQPIPFELPAQDHVVIQIPERTPSIADRIIRNYELRLMKALPAVDAKYNLVTIITPEGVHQLNQEINAFKCLLTAEEFQVKHGSVFLRRAESVISEEGELIHGELTLKELNLLESSIRMRRGHTITGYSINEEVFLRTLGEYPPAPSAFSKRVLDTMHAPIVRDVSVSIRAGAQSLIFFGYLTTAYFQYDKKNAAAYDSYFYNNVLVFLLVTMCVASSGLFLLRSGLIEKEIVLSRMNRLKLIEESVIGTSRNWTTYSSLISLSPSIIAYGVMPALLLGALKGYFNSNQLYTVPVINVANRTKIKTLLKGLEYAFTTGSFVSLGLEYFTLDCVFARNIDDARGFSENAFDLSMIEYTAFAVAFICHLARYPHYPDWVQNYGRYGSNVSNTIGSVCLDNFATFSIMSMIIQLSIGDYISPAQLGLLTFFYGSQVVVFLYCVFTTIALTPDLPEYSIEHNPSEKTIITLFNEKIEQFKTLMSSCTQQRTKSLSERNVSIELPVSIAADISGFSFFRKVNVLDASSVSNIELDGRGPREL